MNEEYFRKFANFRAGHEIHLEGNSSHPENKDKFGNLHKIIKEAKVFEISDEMKKLLLLTKPNPDNTELEFPYPVMFLDVAFSKIELLEQFGINIKQDAVEGLLVYKVPLEEVDWEKHNSPVMSREDIKGIAIRIVSLVTENEETFFDFIDIPLIWDEENPVSMYYADKNLVYLNQSFFLNFLSLVNNPEIELVENPKSEKNVARHTKKGQVTAKASVKIELTGHVLRYVNEISSHIGVGFNYKFWVRGHWRNLIHPKFKKVKRTWVFPYIKGHGQLIHQTYIVKEKVKE